MTIVGASLSVPAVAAASEAGPPTSVINSAVTVQANKPVASAVTVDVNKPVTTTVELQRKSDDDDSNWGWIGIFGLLGLLGLLGLRRRHNDTLGPRTGSVPADTTPRGAHRGDVTP